VSSRGRLKWAVHGVGSAATYETELSHATVPQHHLLCSRESCSRESALYRKSTSSVL